MRSWMLLFKRQGLHHSHREKINDYDWVDWLQWHIEIKIFLGILMGTGRSRKAKWDYIDQIFHITKMRYIIKKTDKQTWFDLLKIWFANAPCSMLKNIKEPCFSKILKLVQLVHKLYKKVMIPKESIIFGKSTIPWCVQLISRQYGVKLYTLCIENATLTKWKCMLAKKDITGKTGHTEKITMCFVSDLLVKVCDSIIWYIF